MKTASEIIACAADLIEQKGWTQGHYAKDSQGNVVNPGSPRAACYCTLGALEACSPPDIGTDKWLEITDKVNAALPIQVGIPYWNDNYAESKEEVVAMLRRAANKGN